MRFPIPAITRVSLLPSQLLGRSLSRQLATSSTPSPSAVSAAAAKAPHSSPTTVPICPELESLVERICSLDLLKTSQLVGLLKKKLNLPDVMPAPMVMAAPLTGSAAAATVAPAAPQVEKTEFRVTLDKFDPTSKAKVIREIKGLLPQLNLVEAKNFVEGAPKVIKEKVKKEEAEKIKKTLEDLGATITLD